MGSRSRAVPDRNRRAVEILTSVFVEEMLHLTLVANVLNSVGGRPRLDAPQRRARCLAAYLLPSATAFKLARPFSISPPIIFWPLKMTGTWKFWIHGCSAYSSL